MPEYLYRIQPARLEMLQESTSEETEIVSQHFAYLQENAENGIVLLAGRTQNTDASTFGIIIFRAESELAAHRFVEADPGVKRGVFRAELFPYRVALLSDTYSRE